MCYNFRLMSPMSGVAVPEQWNTRHSDWWCQWTIKLNLRHRVWCESDSHGFALLDKIREADWFNYLWESDQNLFHVDINAPKKCYVKSTTRKINGRLKITIHIFSFCLFGSVRWKFNHTLDTRDAFEINLSWNCAWKRKKNSPIRSLFENSVFFLVWHGLLTTNINMQDWLLFSNNNNQKTLNDM